MSIGITALPAVCENKHARFLSYSLIIWHQTDNTRAATGWKITHTTKILFYAEFVVNCSLLMLMLHHNGLHNQAATTDVLFFVLFVVKSQSTPRQKAENY